MTPLSLKFFRITGELIPKCAKRIFRIFRTQTVLAEAAELALKILKILKRLHNGLFYPTTHGLK